MLPPKAKQRKHCLIKHGHTRIDPYYWMRLSDKQKDAKNPDTQTKEVLNYIQQEQTYLKNQLKHLEPLQEKLFFEMTGRLKQKDSSVAYLRRGYYYYTRYEGDQEYPIYARKKNLLNATEEILLDVNKLAKGYSYFCISELSISPNNKWLIYSQDCKGNGVYTLYFKHIKSQQTCKYKLKNCSGSVCWTHDSAHVFYVKLNPETLREESVYLHNFNFEAEQNDQSKDRLVYYEADESFSISLSKSKSEKYIFIECEASLKSETLILDPNSPLKKPKHLVKRQHNHSYQLDHIDNHFYILSNLNAKNNFLAKFNLTDLKPENWTIIVAHNPCVHLLDFEVFRHHIAIIQRQNSFKQLKILNTHLQKNHIIDFDQAFYNIEFDINHHIDSSHLRIYFSSLCTPDSLFELNMNSFKKTLLKQEKLVGDYNQENYVTKRLFAKAADGQDIPLSLVYNKNLKQSKPQRLLLYGYGAYGITVEADFNAARLSLLDRGFIFAIAHIRGSEIFGKESYYQGKGHLKTNTFNDFIAAAKFLIQQNYTNHSQLFAMGESAGGLLMAVVANLEPSLFKGIVNIVPFVDVVTSMSDKTIPLTTFEYDEWGNPKNKDDYHNMLSYSPYDNIKLQKYPNMLVSTGFYDSQVQYWEPLKYVAKCRTHWEGKNKLFLHVNMNAGHSGSSGRFKEHNDLALFYSFLLSL